MAHTQKQKKKLNIIVIITKLWAGIKFFFYRQKYLQK